MPVSRSRNEVPVFESSPPEIVGLSLHELAAAKPVPEPEPVKSSEKRTAALALPASIAIEAIAEAIMVFVCAFIVV